MKFVEFYNKVKDNQTMALHDQNLRLLSNKEKQKAQLERAGQKNAKDLQLFLQKREDLYKEMQ